jgi:hypothetical protein
MAVLDLNYNADLKFSSFFVTKTLRFHYKDLFVDTLGKFAVYSGNHKKHVNVLYAKLSFYWYSRRASSG